MTKVAQSTTEGSRYQREAYRRRRDAGLCVECPASDIRPAAPNRSRCPTCLERSSALGRTRDKEAVRAWRAANRHREAGYYLRHQFGLTVEQFQALNDAQGGRCAICGVVPSGRFKRLSVDHDHRTGRFRGLLCWWCNRGIGFLQDDPEKMRGAIAYLTAGLTDDPTHPPLTLSRRLSGGPRRPARAARPDAP